MKLKRRLSNSICLMVMMILTGILAPVGISAEDIKLSEGQTVYVKIYSHI